MAESNDVIVRRGRSAREVLESDVFRESVLAVEADIVIQWREGKTPQAREEAHAHLKALDAVVRKLRVTMERGELATLED